MRTSTQHSLGPSYNGARSNCVCTLYSEIDTETRLASSRGRGQAKVGRGEGRVGRRQNTIKNPRHKMRVVASPIRRAGAAEARLHKGNQLSDILSLLRAQCLRARFQRNDLSRDSDLRIRSKKIRVGREARRIGPGGDVLDLCRLRSATANCWNRPRLPWARRSTLPPAELL